MREQKHQHAPRRQYGDNDDFDLKSNYGKKHYNNDYDQSDFYVGRKAPRYQSYIACRMSIVIYT